MSLDLTRPLRFALAALAALVIAPCGLADAPAEGTPEVPQFSARERFQRAHPGADFYIMPGDRIGRVYGPAFSTGATPIESAERFRLQHADLFDVAPEELVLEGPYADRHFLQPIMWDGDRNDYRFYLVCYAQKVAGVSVHTGMLKLLVRNEPGFPLVLASADVRPLSADARELALAAKPPRALDERRFAARAFDQFGSRPKVSGVESVLWAGVDSELAPTRLGVRFEAEGGTVFDPANYRKFRYICDADSGTILFQENLVLHQDISGQVQGMSTDGIGADICDDEIPMAMPYARVTAGSSTIYADADGHFTIPMASPGSVSINSLIRGQYFVVNNQAGAGGSVTVTGTSGEPVEVMHNEANTSATNRAEVNVYICANTVRDFTLAQNPAYPTIANQTQFPANTNIADTCNAFYNGSSINFYQAGGGCTNTGNSTVVFHEYGHHLINSGGSGQGAYGEGMSDTVAVAITDSPFLGLGFQSNCSTPLRNADNNIQYPCSTPIHSCGRVMSGCAWSTRQCLVDAGVEGYRDLIGSWVINSILLHNGTEITPQITIDWLTLDDNNDDITDGTPHYDCIDAGFSAHNMPAPEISLLAITYPEGLPAMVAPDGSTEFLVQVLPLGGTPNGNVQFAWRPAGIGSYSLVPAVGLGSNRYRATVPASECGSEIEFYLVAETTTGIEVTSPSAGPGGPFMAVSAVDLLQVYYDNCDSAQDGWVVTNSAGLTDGAWEQGVPIGGGVRGDPANDYDPGSGGGAWLTANRAGNSDVDGGTTTLTTANFDASDPQSLICYARWFSNTFGNAPNEDEMVVEISGNAGAAWVELETVGPTGPEADGGWYQVCFKVADYVTPGDQVRLRFTVGDLINGSVVEAALDAFEIKVIECGDDGVFADLNDDGIVNGADLAIQLGQWGGPGSGDLNDDGIVNGADLALMLGAWTG